MRNLVIGRIPADFDPETHVALGPWCFAGAEHIWPEWDEQEFVRTVPGYEEHYEASENTRKLANFWVDRLWPDLNRRHGTSYGRPFWHVMLIFWLIHVVDASWRRYLHVKQFIDGLAGEPLRVELSDVEAPWQVENTYRIVFDINYGAAFHQWLNDRIIRLLAPRSWDVVPSRQASAGPPKRSDPSAIPEHQPAAREYSVPRAPIGVVYGLEGVKYVPRLLAWLAMLSPWRRPRSYPLGDYQPEKDFPPLYLDLLEELVRDTMPRNFTDNFAELDSFGRRHRYYPGRLQVGVVQFFFDEHNIKTAHAVENGERVVSVQHGGGYGYNGMLGMVAEAEYYHHAFITWGWREQQDYQCRFIPLPSPKLSRVANRHHAENDDLILVGTGMAHFSPRLDIWPVPIEYRKWKRRFLAALDDRIADRTAYRPIHHPDPETALDDADYVRRFFPDMRILGGSLDEALLGCRLLVMDHPGTTLNVALAANVPTVCFWNKREWHLARQAIPYFERLEQAGILFSSAEEAARHVNAVWGGVEGWWSTSAVQEARRAWCRQYARTSPVWWLHWALAMLRI